MREPLPPQLTNCAATARVTWAHYPSMMKFVCLVFLIAKTARSLRVLQGGSEAPSHELLWDASEESTDIQRGGAPLLEVITAKQKRKKDMR